MKRYIHHWPTIAMFALFYLVSLFCNFALQWSQWVAVLVGAIVALPLGVVLLLWRDRIELRAKSTEQLRIYPAVGTIEFEYDGKRYRGIVQKIEKEHEG